MQEIVRSLPFCHVEAPGQHEGAKTLPAASVHCRYHFQTLRLSLTVIVSLLLFHAAILPLFNMLMVTLTPQVYLPFHGPAV